MGNNQLTKFLKIFQLALVSRLAAPHICLLKTKEGLGPRGPPGALPSPHCRGLCPAHTSGTWVPQGSALGGSQQQAGAERAAEIACAVRPSGRLPFPRSLGERKHAGQAGLLGRDRKSTRLNSSH